MICTRLYATLPSLCMQTHRCHLLVSVFNGMVGAESCCLLQSIVSRQNSRGLRMQPILTVMSAP